jgi:hypothetical protein
MSGLVEPDPSSPGSVDRSAAEQAEPGFRERGRMRRRARYLRQLRELQLRDVGGFLLECNRSRRERSDLVAEKVAAAARTDRELRALEQALATQQPVRELREPGIGGACEGCGAIHGSADRFCATCGRKLVSGEHPGRGGDQPERR